MAPEVPDEELMVRIGQGDVFAYTALVRRHVASVYRTAYRMLHDNFEAEDIAQESFARLWQNAPRWNGAGAGVSAWLGRVCTNLCLDQLRKRGRWSYDELPELIDPAIPADKLVDQAQCQRLLEDCLKALSGNHRAAIVLTYYEGHPNKTAAELMGMDVKAFESLLYRARQKLGALLVRDGVGPQDLELLA